MTPTQGSGSYRGHPTPQLRSFYMEYILRKIQRIGSYAQEAISVGGSTKWNFFQRWLRKNFNGGKYTNDKHIYIFFNKFQMDCSWQLRNFYSKFSKFPYRCILSHDASNLFYIQALRFNFIQIIHKQLQMIYQTFLSSLDY